MGAALEHTWKVEMPYHLQKFFKGRVLSPQEAASPRESGQPFRYTRPMPAGHSSEPITRPPNHEPLPLYQPTQPTQPTRPTEEPPAYS